MPVESTELCIRCGKVQPCIANRICGGVRYRCGVCGAGLGFDWDDDDFSEDARRADVTEQERQDRLELEAGWQELER